MNNNRLRRCVAIFLLILAQCSQATYPSEFDQLVRSASLVFRGKVVLLHTVTTDEDDVSDTGVVTVMDVIDAPVSFRRISGSQVTVHFTDISKATVGEDRIFFTEPYWIGESLGVREKGSIAKSNKLYDSKEISSYVRQARLKQDDQKLKVIMQTSGLIFSGKVLKIGVPEGYKRTATEHDPEWKEAEIEIGEFLKSRAAGKTIKILFSSSLDIMFQASPKLKPGDEGIFITQATDSKLAGPVKNPLMIVDKMGFIQGKERIKQIKSLLQ